MLHGRLLSNHSYISLEELGQGHFDSLICLTDKDIFNIRPRQGEWYFPNGTRVPIENGGWIFYRNRDLKMVRLHQKYATDSVSGMFRCEVNGSLNISYVLYAGIFPDNQGNSYYSSVYIAVIMLLLNLIYLYIYNCCDSELKASTFLYFCSRWTWYFSWYSVPVSV